LLSFDDSLVLRDTPLLQIKKSTQQQEKKVKTNFNKKVNYKTGSHGGGGL